MPGAAVTGAQRPTGELRASISSVPSGRLAAVSITLPGGQPSHRFMRYVRPPIKDDEDHSALFLLRPGTRPLRLGIDLTTVPTPPDGLLAGYLVRDEIDVQLLVPADQEVPLRGRLHLVIPWCVRSGSRQSRPPVVFATRCSSA